MPSPFLVMATQNPIESEGTYPLPEAQLDRFMLKIVVDYPRRGGRADRDRARARRARRRRAARLGRGARGAPAATRRVYVDPAVSRYALEIALATRRLAERGLGDLAEYVAFGASPRGPINLVLGARALALLRGRRYALPQDVRELAKDVLRHRMVLSYEALAEGVEADTVLDRVLEAVEMPHARPRARSRSHERPPPALAPVRTPGRPGPGRDCRARCCASST